MTSKERVRKALMHIQPDVVPVDFACTQSTMEKLIKHYCFDREDQVYDRLDIDIRLVNPLYTGPELKSYCENGIQVQESYWGFKKKKYWNGKDYDSITCHYPFSDCESIDEIEAYQWPNADWFDYESVKHQCEKFRDRAIIIGSPGVYQYATFMREPEKLYMDMALHPELAQKIFDKFVAFELEYYERILQAADGQIDILRCHDDYGTQTSLLFSVDMWKRFFKSNTEKLSNLAHKYKGFYMQHSCGAVREIIPELIECGVDALDPVQKVKGMEPEGLKNDFGDKICFHGGIDTQFILPSGTAEDVRRETRYFIETLSVNGGYILYPSQEFQPDVPIENIEMMYKSRYG
ncbi:MAG: hypothetical protein A2Y21_11220 [Clostridiales bacterium GWC2_40_7]|nr:MAG: hypothetical protein A2Y21_11220 [Clostridiales bacterium GWC2_40_7]